MNKVTSLKLAFKLWVFSALSLSAITTLYFVVTYTEALTIIANIVATFIGSIPALIALLIIQPLIKKLFLSYQVRITLLLCFSIFIALCYGLLEGSIFYNLYYTTSFLSSACITSIAVISSVITAVFINFKYIKTYFNSSNQKTHNMENLSIATAQTYEQNFSNKTWVKGLITAGLILLMLIPTLFVSNLVEERKDRMQQVKEEVSSKWASEQSITFPYLYIPYTTITKAKYDTLKETKSFIILPENLTVSGNVSTEERKRSIYNVLLYTSNLNAKGNFNIQIPADVDASTINWNDVKLCLGITDFKGIQQKITTSINNINYDFAAGLPTNEIDSTGLSTLIPLSANNINKPLSFNLPLRIKCSDNLHFVPLAGNSQFNLKSNWSSPSFDGNSLPAERSLGANGFEANWSFNKANLPFSTTLKNFNFKKDDYAFGASLLQPTDQYAKALRCIKYAILFIGLTFSLFFIVEIMQKKPFHPVQYILVGLALIIFFTLLLSISEFLLFDIAYLIASVATILLITFYAKSHFKSWKIAAVFAAVISSIYAFIFVLIRLEDTALLVGSIGLFVILCLAMYASKKINWYATTLDENINLQNS